MQVYINARFLTQPISGVQRYGIEISRQIKCKKSDVILLAPYNVIHNDIARELDVQIIGVNKGPIWEQIDLPLFLRNKDAVLFNLCNTAPLFFSSNYLTIHDLAFKLYPQWNSKLFAKFYNFLIPKISKRAKHIFTVSNTVKNELVEYLQLPPEKISITYNGLAPHLKPDKITSEKENIILAVGSFNLRKNHHQLIKAFLHSSVCETYELWIIGNVEKIYSEMQLDETAKNVRIVHDVSDEMLVSIYRKAKLAVSLSQYEGFGIPVLEGLCFGCKVICSDIAVFRELYDKYVYFCAPQNIKDISKALEDSIQQDNKVSTFIIPEEYSYEKSAQIILNQILFEKKI